MPKPSKQRVAIYARVSTAYPGIHLSFIGHTHDFKTIDGGINRLHEFGLIGLMDYTKRKAA